MDHGDLLLLLLLVENLLLLALGLAELFLVLGAALLAARLKQF